MSDSYQIIPLDKPAWNVIGGGISDFNLQHAGDDSSKPFCFVVQDQNQEIIAGIICDTVYDWLNINLLWVREDLRGMGFGSQLLALAEDEARKLDIKNAFLDTFSFQAPDFYKKHGYHVFGELYDFPKGHTRYYLTKHL